MNNDPNWLTIKRLKGQGSRNRIVIVLHEDINQNLLVLTQILQSIRDSYQSYMHEWFHILFSRRHELVRNNMHAASFNILLGYEICAISLEHDREIENTSYFVWRNVKALVYCSDKTRIYIAFIRTRYVKGS